MFRTFSSPHLKVQKFTVGESRTKQSFANECEINNIMRKYEKTGILTHAKEHKGDYGNYIDVQDYKTNLEKILSAGEMFSELPSGLRKQFDNSPVQFLQFVQDPKNTEKMAELGLIKKPLATAPKSTTTTTEPISEPSAAT